MLDRPPPPTVLVKYDRARVDDFIEIADNIEEAFPQVIVEGIECEDGASLEGQIHVSLNGETIPSSADSGAAGESDVQIPFLIENLETVLRKKFDDDF